MKDPVLKPYCGILLVAVLSLAPPSGSEALIAVQNVAAAEARRIPLIVPGTEVVAIESRRGDRGGFNDFCVFQDDNRLWHLFAISTHRPSDPAFRYPSLLHATSRTITGAWERQPYVDLGAMHNWAPWIIRDPCRPSTCVMFVGGTGEETLRTYESDAHDLFRWQPRKDLGRTHGTRDAMVRFDENERQYYLYATLASPTNGNEGIAVSVSADLDNWRTVGVIPTGAANTCDESPFVVTHDGWYYLWATVSSIHYYRGIPTRVFCSKHADFRDLPNTRAEHALYSIPMHAVEIVEADGESWIGQTGHEGPGIVFSRLRWGADGTTRRLAPAGLPYEGEWIGTNRRASSQPGASFECRFTGGRIEWHGNKSPSGGKADIFMDGKRVGLADQYGFERNAPSDEYRGAFLWISDDMPQGEHVLRVVVRDDNNPASRGTMITVTQVTVTQFQRAGFPAELSTLLRVQLAGSRYAVGGSSMFRWLGVEVRSAS
jgi:hypothetical protein